MNFSIFFNLFFPLPPYIIHVKNTETTRSPKPMILLFFDNLTVTCIMHHILY